MSLPDPPSQQHPASVENERRVNTHLRLIFEDACRITAPFFDPQQEWSKTHLTLLAQQALRAAYPELTLQDIALLFSGVQSFHLAVLNKQQHRT